MSIGNTLKEYILGYKTNAQIITDFKEQFPIYASYSDDVISIYIDLNYYLIPAGVIESGFESTYKMFLYGLAHLLVSQGVQADGTSSSAEDRITKTMSAGGLSLSYKDLGTEGTMAEWEYFFGNSNYGKIVLMLLKVNGFGSSWGGYVI